MNQFENRIRKILRKQEQWLESEGYRGWEPFDALNSPILKKFNCNRMLGIIILQVLRRLPINLRPLLGIAKDYNAKGMGLFLSAYARKFALTQQPEDLKKIYYFTNWLVENANTEYGGMGWGYNFDWPNRAFYAPKGTPTIVNTSFIGNGFLEAYHVTQDETFLTYAEKACQFIISGLNTTADQDGKCTSYTPLDHSCVHNANMLGAALLADVGKCVGNDNFINEAICRMDFSLAKQLDDGSWFYGEANNQKWIDSFHTGYNLLSLLRIWRVTKEECYHFSIHRGFCYYLNNFLTEDGIVTYYPSKKYPKEAHAYAAAIICLCELSTYTKENGKYEILPKVVEQTIELFWDLKGYFYYKKTPIYTIKIPYIRWVQAWVFLALTTFCNMEVE